MALKDWSYPKKGATYGLIIGILLFIITVWIYFPVCGFAANPATKEGVQCKDPLLFSNPIGIFSSIPLIISNLIPIRSETPLWIIIQIAYFLVYVAQTSLIGALIGLAYYKIRVNVKSK